MSENTYLLVLANKSLKPLKPLIQELGGFYNQIGYAFPMHRKQEVEALFKEFDAKSLKILTQPLLEGNFEAYKLAHKLDFYQKALLEKKDEIASFQHRFQEQDPSSMQPQEQEHWLKLIHEKEELEEQIKWAASLEKASYRKVSLQFLSELPVDFLKIDPPPKRRILYWTDEKGKKQTLLPKEIVAMLVGAGGIGKTHLLANLALAVASGFPFLERFEVEKPSSVCLILGENKMDDIHRLLRKTAKSSKFPLKGVEKRLCIYSAHGQSSHFIKEGHPTPFYFDFLQTLKEKQPEEGWTLLIFDPISRFAGLDAEKDNAAATDFIALLERMSDELIGNPTILISHHKPKPSVGMKESDQTAARGASGLTDGVRWQANLDKQEENIVVFRIVKSNFTSIPHPFKIIKMDDGSLGYHSPIERPKPKETTNSTNRIIDVH